MNNLLLFATSSPVRQAAMFILLLLTFSSFLVWLLTKILPQTDWKELTLRVRSWWIMATVFLVAVTVNRTLTLLFFALMSFWVLKEYITILDTRRADHRALFWAFLVIPIHYYFISINWYLMFLIFIPVYVFLFLPLRLVLTEKTEGFLSSAAKIQWGLMAFVFGLSHMAYLSIMPRIGGLPSSGQTLLIFLVIVTEMNDVFQYLWGKSLGRHKILPLVSPKKTSEGFWGGIITTSVLSLFLRFLTPFGVFETIFFAFCIAVAGFFGDVVMSAVKRDAGIKDFSNIIPGHGGALDRVDSLCYTAPIFFHLMAYFYY
ncbi:MAG: phosphatidate cytidylyltransferase [Candidatus Omnitrophica bacterium]|nr:phosphatidate cytidylyltransferase [Candidatus Omnitrophota bacterium]